MQLLDCLVVVFLIFWGLAVLFSILATLVYIPTIVFSLLHTLTNIYYSLNFWWMPFWKVWDDNSWFWFIFLYLLVMMRIFSYACWSSVYLIWKIVYSGLLCIFKLGWFFLILHCMSSLFFKLIYLFLAVLGLCCCVGVAVGVGLLSSYSEWVYIAVASLDVEHWLRAHGLQ